MGILVAHMGHGYGSRPNNQTNGCMNTLIEGIRLIGKAYAIDTCLVGGLNPSEKILVNWDDDIPNSRGKIKHVPNHQPDLCLQHYQILFGYTTSTLDLRSTFCQTQCELLWLLIEKIIKQSTSCRSFSKGKPLVNTTSMQTFTLE